MGERSESKNHLQAGARLGSYVITRHIGEGGMGVVYEGVHEGLGKRVAIKTLRGATGPGADELIARFVREGKAAAKINHPNVVGVFDVAVDGDTPYLVMEYLDGEDLAAKMVNQAPMTPGAMADLLVPIVSALAAAHEAGIVHRDLKPENIFITRGKGGALEPKLVDFGISKLQGDGGLHLTGTNTILGTPYYMSPEQAGSSKNVDHRSDIFSFGVILYQCATHELPFNGESLYQLLGEIMHKEPPTVSSIAKQVPAALEAVIARAMQKDPNKRFQTAAELGVALLPFASQRVRLTYEPELRMARSSRPGPRSERARSPSTFEPRSDLAAGGARRRGVWLGLTAIGMVLASVLTGYWLRKRDMAQPAAASVSAVTAPHVAQPAAVHVAQPAPTPEATTVTAAAAIQPAAVPDAGTASRSAEQAAPAEHAEPARTNARDRTSARRRSAATRKTAPASMRVRTNDTPPPAPAVASPAPTAPHRPEPAPDDDLFRDRK